MFNLTIRFDLLLRTVPSSKTEFSKTQNVSQMIFWAHFQNTLLWLTHQQAPLVLFSVCPDKFKLMHTHACPIRQAQLLHTSVVVSIDQYHLHAKRYFPQETKNPNVRHSGSCSLIIIILHHLKESMDLACVIKSMSHTLICFLCVMVIATMCGQERLPEEQNMLTSISKRYRNLFLKK